MKDGLEDHLSALASHASSALAGHLRACPECSATLAGMKSQAQLFNSLRAPEQLDPAPGFYARIMERIEAQAASYSLWNIFLEPVFAKRLVFACLALFVLLGSAVWQTGPDPMLNANNPMTILAGSDLPQAGADDPGRARSVVLVNLASYGGQPSSLAISSD
ncbi:MAG: hypothetical protein HY858_16165 [Candidatus Solibacter usitatus]|nr:hypothetical protein [Candidatus Solibacter usitatus]